MILGITGISGSGKHTLANFFKKKNWNMIDVDKLAHNSYRPYTNVWKNVVEEFGEKILNQDDTINRVRLRKIVFNPLDQELSLKNLKKLNKIVHPYVKRHLKEKLHRLFHRNEHVVIVAALWKEINLKDFCDKIILVKSNYEIRKERILNRDSIMEDVYKMRIKNQKEPSDADYVIENNNDNINNLYNTANDIYLKLDLTLKSNDLYSL